MTLCSQPFPIHFVYIALFDTELCDVPFNVLQAFTCDGLVNVGQIVLKQNLLHLDVYIVNCIQEVSGAKSSCIDTVGLGVGPSTNDSS